MLARGDAERLQAELDRLDEWIDTQQFNAVHDHVLRIRKKLRAAFRYPAYLADYLEDAIAVNAALANPDDVVALDTLCTRAESTIGAADPERKALGAALMVLGIGLLVLSMLLLSTVIACSFPLAGFFLLLGGAASMMLGFSFFRSGLQHGMARELDGLHNRLSV